MLFNAKNGSVHIDDTDMDYVSFGTGNDILVMIPGLGDGLTTVKGMALPMAITYHLFAKKYKVYIFSRKNHLEKGYSTENMASDQAKAMKMLDINKAKILGISQGGMIAQYLAINYPELVERLVLAVTSSKQNTILQDAVEKWIILAEQNDYKNLMTDTAEKSYSEKYLRKYRSLYPILGRIGKPKDLNRFLIQANSCITHNAYSKLDMIMCPTLIVGGECDKIVGVEASMELADKIKRSELYIYNGLGHAAYEEAKDFNKRILDFLSK